MSLQLRLRPCDRVELDAFDAQGNPVRVTLVAVPDNSSHTRVRLDAVGIQARVIKPTPPTNPTR